MHFGRHCHAGGSSSAFLLSQSLLYVELEISGTCQKSAVPCLP
jgi:hypothetical protein